MRIKKIKLAGYSKALGFFENNEGIGSSIYASKNGFESEWRIIGLVSNLMDDIKSHLAFGQEEVKFVKIEHNQTRLGIGYLEFE
jgi:hypothetical protein